MSETYPDVPQDSGVPPLNRNPYAAQSPAPTPMSGDDPGVINSTSQTPQWGIMDSSGAVAIQGDAFIRLEHVADIDVPTYPVEGGGFQSYNRVQHPVTVKVTLAKGGTVADRDAFLASINVALYSTSLYSVVTPDETYSDMSIVHRDMRRDATGGVTLLTVEIWCGQAITSATSAFTSTASPAGADTVNQGPVQPQTPTADQTAAAADGAN